MRSCTESNDQQTCFESLHFSVPSSVCPSLSPYISHIKSIHAETQSGRIVARSGLFPFCSLSIAEWLKSLRIGIAVKIPSERLAQSERTTHCHDLNAPISTCGNCRFVNCDKWSRYNDRGNHHFIHCDDMAALQ